MDHRRAYLVWTDEDGAVDLWRTEAEYHERREKPGRMVAGPTGVHGALAAHVNQEQKRRREARRFYEGIIRAIRGAKKVYIFGPGQAKKELEKALARHKNFGGRVLGVESAEKMTAAQMAARVKKFFTVPRSAA